jgi:hypothetical protein
VPDPLTIATMAGIRLSAAGFRKLAAYFAKSGQTKTLDKQIAAAWSEILKGDGSDDAVIEAALAAAGAAGHSTPDSVRLNAAYTRSRTSKKKAGKSLAKKKAAKGKKGKAGPRRPSVRKKARK